MKRSPRLPQWRALKPGARALPKALGAERIELELADCPPVSCYRAGPAGARPLLLVHSVNAAPSALEMKPLFEHYRRERLVYALELPGFGFSERADRRYSPELYERGIRRFLEETAAESADVVGFSLSAELLARAALDNPAIASLVLISPTGMGRQRGEPGPVAERVRRVLNLPGLGPVLFAGLTCRRSIAYFLAKNFEGETPAEMIDYGWRTAHQPGAHHAPFYFLTGQLFTPQACERVYRQVEQPVLVLYDQDPNVSFEHLPALLRNKPRWQAVRIAPTRGLPHWEKPAETFAAIDAFWAGLEARAQSASDPGVPGPGTRENHCPRSDS